MEDLKFTQISVGELKIESPTDFCMHSLGNDFVLGSIGNHFFIMEMLYYSNALNITPFRVQQVKVLEEKPLVNLLKHVDYVGIYRRESVLETQELALDHIFITECSMEPPKARLIKAELVPSNNNTRLCCVLTSYGACDLIGQDPISLEWCPLNTKLVQLLISEVYPIKKSPSDISNFAELRRFVDTYYITSFAWCCTERGVLYLGTAIGDVIALQYNEIEKNFELLAKIRTSMGRISYLKSEHFILAGCSHGQVCLLKFDHNLKKLRQLDYLWNKKDRMACRKGIITYNDETKTYLVIFCKASHLLAFRLDSEGMIMSKSRTQFSGIKATGLELLSDNEFIITTVMCSIHYALLTFPTKEELKIVIQSVKHDMDASNFQILGVNSTLSRNLWSFLLFHNKDYTHQSKYNQSTALLSTCKLNTQDSLLKLSSINATVMDTAQDLFMAINIDINNNYNVERYSNFLVINQLKCPTEISDQFVQKLQKKFTILRQIASYQKMKIKCVKRPIEAEINFLQQALQMLHILQRLMYLQSYCIGEVNLSAFQELVVTCMQAQFLRLFNSLKNVDAENENPFQASIDDFAKRITELYEKCKFDTTNFKQTKEYCWMCNEEINAPSSDKCRNEHEINRCTISFIQITLFLTKHCPNCGALATNDDLSELFAPNEFVKCTFCRYMLKADIS